MDNNFNVVLEMDRPRNLRYGSKALKNIQKMYGCDIQDFRIEKLDVDTVTNLLHIGMQPDDPSLTLEQTENLLDQFVPYHLQLSKFFEAWNATWGMKNNPNFQGVQDAPIQETAQKQKNGTGKNLTKTVTD